MDNKVNLYVRRESATVFAPPRRACLPVTVVTGPLGAGKTTLLNHILSNKQSLRVAALVNDFAALNVDKALVAESGNASAGVVELTNGCLCCTLAESTQAAVWKILLGEHPEVAGGGRDIDYLVVETSGVADPVGLVTSLDAKFGKMTRVRLDSVVTVVDADLMYHDCVVGGNVMGHAVQSQLRCADVILLNKVSLIRSADGERVAAVRQLLRTTCHPRTAVHECDYSAVPLPCILDVTAVADTAAVVSHEGGAALGRAPLLVSTSAGTLRTTRVQTTHSGGAGSGAHAHLQRDGFTSFVYERPGRVFALGRFQALLAGVPSARAASVPASAGAGAKAAEKASVGGDESATAGACRDPPCLPLSLTRVKGDVAFAEDVVTLRGDSPGATVAGGAGVFQLSGRRRLEFRLNEAALGHTLTRRGIRLALIGTGTWDQGVVTAALDWALAPEPPVASEPTVSAKGPASRASDAVQHVLKDGRFEAGLLPSTHSQRCGSGSAHTRVLFFRLTCAAKYGVTLSELETIRGVDIRAANEALLQAVNSSGQGVLLTACVVPRVWLGSPDNRAATRSGSREEDETKTAPTDVADATAKSRRGRVHALRFCWSADCGVEPYTFFMTSVWPTLVAETDKVEQEYFRTARQCLCGF